jgi:phospholipase/carboxylesterase
MTAPELPLFYLAKRPDAPEAPAALVVLLHGYGSNEDDLFQLTPALDQRLTVLSARAPLFLAPGAFAWFEIAFTREGIAVDERQAERSRQTLAEFVERAGAAFGAGPGHTVLVGFSQGATMAALLALTRPDLVAGAAVLSGIVPSDLLSMAPDRAALAGRRFLVAHGTQDTVVPVEHGRATRELLDGLGAQVQYREEHVGHGIGPQTLRDLADWLAGMLNAER